MKRLYYIQYLGSENVNIDRQIQNLGKFHQVFNGWVVESTKDAKSIYDILGVFAPTIHFVVLGLDKTNYYGRYSKELWAFFK